MRAIKAGFCTLMVAVVVSLLFALVRPAYSSAWQVPLQIENGAHYSLTLTFGVHPNGTDGVDPDLGEVELPPWPPGSLFDARFLIPGCEGLRLDVRDTTHTERLHTVKWQEGSGGYPIVVRWDRESLPYATLHISDGYGGVFIPPINMYYTDSLVVPASKSFIKMLTIDVIPGVSPGADPVISGIVGASIFAGQRFADYRLDDYVYDPDNPDSTLQWFVTENQALVFHIDSARVMHIEAPEGWTGQEVVTLTVRDPDHHTGQVDLLFAVMSGGVPAWGVPLTVANGSSQQRTVYLGISPGATDGIDPYLDEVALPPWPPSDVYDVRFNLPDLVSWSERDIRASSPSSISYHLCWQAGSGGYPISVQWSSDLPLGDFSISDDLGGVFIPPLDMRDTSGIVIPASRSFITGLRISVVPVVDTIAPSGPDSLRVIGWIPGVSVTLGWSQCVEEHFAYYEILYDSLYFEARAAYSWDWSEDSSLAAISTVTATLPLTGAAYYHMFRIRAWDRFGNCSIVSNLVSVPDCSGLPPAEGPGGSSGAGLLSVFPNPTRGSTNIRVRSDGHSSVRVRVFDAEGRLVSGPSVDTPRDGVAAYIWSGRDLQGRRLAPGIYICRVEMQAGVVSRKIVLVN